MQEYQNITSVILLLVIKFLADPCGNLDYSVGLRLLACLDCGFESHRGMDVSCEYCVPSGRGPCDRPITRPGKSYRV